MAERRWAGAVGREEIFGQLSGKIGKQKGENEFDRNKSQLPARTNSLERNKSDAFITT